MKNPLFKRLKREFFHDIAKYIVIFLFLVLPISLCAGYMIGNDSMIRTYNEGYEKYNLEDGHFASLFALDDEVLSKIEEDENISVSKAFYKNEENAKGHTVRIYRGSDRKIVNTVCLHGENSKLPTADDEIALDRLYCENNKISLGDEYKIGDRTFTVTAFISLFDYSCLFKNNNDSMFNATSFTIAIVTDGGFEKFGDGNLVYNYFYRFPQRYDEKKAKTENSELRKYLYESCLSVGAPLSDFLAKEDNQAIKFSINDIEGDLTMMLIFGVLIVGGLAFVFALSIKSQIESETGSIGTLKAMGYKNGELLVHYLVLPTLTTLLAGAVGNILAYTALKDYLVALYYHSYSLPVYTTYYNADALLWTTIVPILLVTLINFVILIRALKIPALNFLRGDLKVKKHKKVVKLNQKIPFMTRFGTRVILQNKGTYFALFVGTFFACVILFFGLMMSPLLDHYKTEVLNSLIAPYQTVLKADVEIEDEKAEKLLFTQLSYEKDDIMVYGVTEFGEKSAYLKTLEIEDGKVVVNGALNEKYGFKKGDEIKLVDKFNDEEYSFDISGVEKNEGSLIVFMGEKQFKDAFKEGDYFVSYLSEEKLSVDDALVYKTITVDDLMTISNQLADSMGDVFTLFTAFSVVLFALLIFLLGKIVVEKNRNQISMMKILGYKTREINRAYNIPTGIVVIISVIIDTLLSQFLIKLLWDIFLRIKMRGWLNFYVAPYLYPLIILIGLVSFTAVYFIESYKISKISLSETLKGGNL
ncbi:MAG: ABC transporter permease [Clostridia bacterium]|nr:ABC transporter permease [Clostridia bacterium]